MLIYIYVYVQVQNPIVKYVPLLKNTGRDVTHSADLRAPWFLQVGIGASAIPIITGSILSPILGLIGMTSAAHLMISITCFAPGVLELVTAISFSLPSVWHDPSDSIYWWFHALVDMLTGVIFYLRQDKLLYIPPLHFVVTLLSFNLHNFLLLDATYFEAPLGSVLFFGLWAFVMSIRQWVMHKTQKFIARDTEIYERVWNNILSTEGNDAALAHLAAATAGLVECSPERPVQLHLTNEELLILPMLARKHPTYDGTLGTLYGQVSEGLKGQHDGDRWRELLHDALSSFETHHSIQSLDLLYAQAMILNPILQTKVQQIALASSGQFLENAVSSTKETRASPAATDESHDSAPTTLPSNTSSSEQTGEDDIASATTSPQSISFVAAHVWPRQGALKSVDRVIEKLVRSYRGNVSLVCDIVRQCIVFETVGDICRAVEAIKNDPHIRIVRVKNRMTGSYDAKKLSCRCACVMCISTCFKMYVCVRMCVCVYV